MSAQELRARWEEEKRLSLRLALLLGGIAIVGIVVASMSWRLSLSSTIGAMLIGALVWQLIISAFSVMRERLRSSDLPPLMGDRLGITIIAILLFLLGFSGFAHVPGWLAPMVLGGLTLAAASAALRVRELHRPRCFVEIRDDCRVLTVQKGTQLLSALEEAGFRLMTQCGQKGSCSTCRVRVLHGPQSWSEAHYGPVMTPKQRHEGWVLSCKVKVEEDMIIELFKPLVVRWPRFKLSRLTETAQLIRRALPGFDCEACGYPTCDEYAQAASQGSAPLTRCLPGGAPVRERLQELAERLKLAR